MAQFPNHLHVVVYSFVESFCLQRFPYRLQILHLLGQVVTNLYKGLVDSFLGCDTEVGWIDVYLVERTDSVPM